MRPSSPIPLFSIWLATFLAWPGGTQLAAQSTMDSVWVVRWTEDLEFARRALTDQHPSPFDAILPEELEAAFDTLTDRLPDLDHHDVIVELACIVARLEDGHTRVSLPLAEGVKFMQGHSPTASPTLPEMEFGQYPLRFGIDALGIWVESVARGNERLLGARLVAIDGRSADEVIERVHPTIRADNEMQVKHHLPMHLVLPELLHARGVVGRVDGAAFEFERRDGSVETVVLSPVADGTLVDWVMAEPMGGVPEPLVRRHNDENFWLSYLPARHVVYLQFNTVYDTERETIRQLGERLSGVLRRAPEAALVIDLRRNRGGDQSLALPLLHAVIGSNQNRAGHLFTIIGRTTFSAAMTFALQLEKHTQTLFVGEPTGSKPNHYGDSRKFVLPNSGVTLRISTLYWQADPRDTRPWIEPHLDAPPSREAQLAGIDPALEAIESLIGGDSDAIELSGTWQGNLLPSSYGNDSVLRFDDTSGAIAASIDIPQLEIERAMPVDLTFQPWTVTFRVPIEDADIAYRLNLRGKWIVGEADAGSVRFPVLLHRRQRIVP